MRRGDLRQVGRRTGQVAAAQRPGLGWLVGGLVLAGAMMAAVPSHAQGTAPNVPTPAPQPGTPSAVPEVVAPHSGSATIPPGNSGSATAPRSENPLTGGETRPMPDRGMSGVIAPPSGGTMPVITPPSTGSTPVIRPAPATPGGTPVVPK